MGSSPPVKRQFLSRESLMTPRAVNLRITLGTDPDFGPAAHRVADHHFAFTHVGFEVAWSLWLACHFDIAVQPPIGALLELMDDDIVALVCTDLHARGLAQGLNPALWSSRINAADLYSDPGSLPMRLSKRNGFIACTAQTTSLTILSSPYWQRPAPLSTTNILWTWAKILNTKMAGTSPNKKM